MSVGPRPQLLALLWPWLLLATLQVRLAVAMAAERSSAAQKAIIRVVPFKLQPLTLEGVFASVAEVMPAEGKLLQFHPLSLCNTSEDEHTVPGFVSIIKLERPQQDRHPCLSLANKAKLAGERGAHAVLFDITNDQSAADQLSQPRGLSHPVVLIWGHDAELLMGVVNNNREAHVKIEVKEMPAWPDYDVWILLTLLSTGLIIASIFIVRTRCQPSRSQTNVQEATLQAISRLATRRYQARPRAAPAADSVSSCSSAPVCAICLEEFSEGQELRIITCLHEFHRQCVDPWLQEHQTCPLCMFNIMEHISSASPLYPLEDPPLRGPGGRPRFFRQHPGRAFYRLPPMAATNCSAALPRGHPFFHSPELSQLDFGTMRYLPYRPVAPDPWCSHQPPLARSLLASQPQEPATREPAPPPRRTCPLAHPFPCRALRVPLAAKLSRGVPLQRGLRHSRHQHHQHYHHHAQSSGSGEMYRTEPSGYLPDGPGSDSSSGPCHGSSSDSVLNCTDASLQAIHGSCSTFHSSLSSDYDPFAFGGTERLASRNGRELPASWRDPQPQSLDPGTGGFSSHVHCHHHHHHHGLHHYGRSPSDGSTGRAGQDLRRTRPPRSRAGSSGPGAQLQKRTEKMLGQDGPSASPDATWARRSPSLRRGEPGRSVPEGPGGSGTEGDQAAAPGPWTSQNTRLQIHPGRRRWKSPHESSLLPPCSPVAQNVSHPRPPGPGSGTRCFQEVQPLLGPSPSELPAPALAQVSSPLARLSVTEPLGEGDTSLGHTDRKPLASGKCLGLEAMEANGSLSFKSPPGQHLQGSDNDDAPDVFEHSV